jgi:hypothetical protein
METEKIVEIDKKSPIEFAKGGLIDILTLSVRCKSCGHSWGIRLYDDIDLTKIPMSKLVCGTCAEQSNRRESKQEIK